MLYLEIGTPADYSIAFLRDLAGLRAGTPSQSQSELPPGIEVGAFGMTGTPESMDAAEYFLVFVDDYNNEEGVLPIEQGDPTVAPRHIPLTLPVTDLELGVPYVIDVTAAGPEGADGSSTQDSPPAGMAFDEYGSVLEGIPSEAGEYALTLKYEDMFGDPLPGDVDVAIHVAGGATIIPAPAAQRTEDGYMLPDVAGVIWTVDGVEQVPGSYSVEPVEVETEVTILPTADVGYAFESEPVPLVLVFLPTPEPDPDPEPEPEPEPVPGPFDPSPAPEEPDEPTEAMWARLMDDDPQAIYVATKLAERIIRHTGQDVADLEPIEVLTARDHAGTVLEYVRGYVRARGFVGYIPHRSLQAVIVSAAARLFVNPEQMTYYSTGDYSERPATMTGWTHAELGVLRRFRRTYR